MMIVSEMRAFRVRCDTRRRSCMARARTTAKASTSVAATRSVAINRRQIIWFCGSLFASSHFTLLQEQEAMASPSASEIYSSYTYMRPQDILSYIRDKAREGDAEAVIQAIDDFSTAFPMYKIGPEKGKILDELVKLAVPEGGLVVELGSFVGYSAVRIARLLPPKARLVCIEANPDCCETIDAVLKHAGLRDRVVIEPGLSSEVLPGLKKKYGQCNLLFEDHCKPCYLPDLIRAEEIGLMGPGSFTIADNVIYPGAPELLSYLKGSSPSEDEIESKPYEGYLIRAKYEYEQRWKMGEEKGDKEDGMSIAVRVKGLDRSQRDKALDQLSNLKQDLKEKLGKEAIPL
jgi:catechol O-methyltransferase